MAVLRSEVPGASSAPAVNGRGREQRRVLDLPTVPGSEHHLGGATASETRPVEDTEAYVPDVLHQFIQQANGKPQTVSTERSLAELARMAAAAQEQIQQEGSVSLSARQPDRPMSLPEERTPGERSAALEQQLIALIQRVHNINPRISKSALMRTIEANTLWGQYLSLNPEFTPQDKAMALDRLFDGVEFQREAPTPITPITAEGAFADTEPVVVTELPTEPADVYESAETEPAPTTGREIAHRSVTVKDAVAPVTKGLGLIGRLTAQVARSAAEEARWRWSGGVEHHSAQDLQKRFFVGEEVKLYKGRLAALRSGDCAVIVTVLQGEAPATHDEIVLPNTAYATEKFGEDADFFQADFDVRVDRQKQHRSYVVKRDGTEYLVQFLPLSDEESQAAITERYGLVREDLSAAIVMFEGYKNADRSAGLPEVYLNGLHTWQEKMLPVFTSLNAWQESSGELAQKAQKRHDHIQASGDTIDYSNTVRADIRTLTEGMRAQRMSVQQSLDVLGSFLSEGDLESQLSTADAEFIQLHKQVLETLEQLPEAKAFDKGKRKLVDDLNLVLTAYDQLSQLSAQVQEQQERLEDRYRQIRLEAGAGERIAQYEQHFGLQELPAEIKEYLTAALRAIDVHTDDMHEDLVAMFAEFGVDLSAQVSQESVDSAFDWMTDWLAAKTALEAQVEDVAYWIAQEVLEPIQEIAFARSSDLQMLELKEEIFEGQAAPTTGRWGAVAGGRVMTPGTMNWNANPGLNAMMSQMAGAVPVLPHGVESMNPDQLRDFVEDQLHTDAEGYWQQLLHIYDSPAFARYFANKKAIPPTLPGMLLMGAATKPVETKSNKRLPTEIAQDLRTLRVDDRILIQELQGIVDGYTDELLNIVPAENFDQVQDLLSERFALLYPLFVEVSGVRAYADNPKDPRLDATLVGDTAFQMNELMDRHLAQLSQQVSRELGADQTTT